jgi:hypothetical protein
MMQSQVSWTHFPRMFSKWGKWGWKIIVAPIYCPLHFGSLRSQRCLLSALVVILVLGSIRAGHPLPSAIQLWGLEPSKAASCLGA